MNFAETDYHVVAMRHGQSEWNVVHRQARADEDGYEPDPNMFDRSDAGYGLTQLGQFQAIHDARPFLAKLAEQGVEFEIFISSDLPRAHDTARLAIPDANWQVTSDLRERDWGLIARAEFMHGDHIGSEWLARISEGDVDHVPEGGESYRQLYERVGRVTRLLTQQHPGRNAIVTGHGETHKAFLANIIGMPVELMNEEIPMLTNVGMYHLIARQNEPFHEIRIYDPTLSDPLVEKSEIIWPDFEIAQ